MPERKPKPPKRNFSKEKRERMVSYGHKVTGNKPYDFKIKKPEIKKFDYDDMENRNLKEKSDFGKLMTFQQKQI